MTVRIETKEIPAQVIETVIVSLPANEWRSMEHRRNLLLAIPFLLVIATVIVAVSSATRAPGFEMFMLTCGCGAASFVLLKCAKIATSLRATLLRKHGWDGESRYRVELEYQQFLHQ